MTTMIPILAVGAVTGASAPSMLSIGVWAMCLAFFVMLINALLKLAQRVRGKAQKPPNAALEAALNAIERRVEAEQTEFEKHVEWNRREHENLFSKIGGVERGGLARMDTISQEWRGFVQQSMGELIRSNNLGREKLHERINTILSEVSEIRGELKGRFHEKKS